MRVHAVWRRVSMTGAPDAYARKVLVNARRGVLRRPWRREYPSEQIPDHPAADHTGAHDDRDALLAALAGLGRSQRAIVVLRYWEDLPVAEVADLLGLAPGTVKSQASRGLEHLRAALTEPAEPVTKGNRP